MINIHLAIHNPWAKENFVSLYEASKLVAKHKAVEFQVMRYALTLFEFSFRWVIRDDHAGLTFEFGLLGYSMMFKFYDCRHWDHEKKAWVVYPDD